MRAFDEFRPGVPGAAPCLAGTPGTSLYLAGGVVTLGKFEGQGVPGCAVSDSSTTPAVSDGSLTGQAMFVMDFSPPLSAFYTYYGSLAVGETVTMTLYSNGALVTQLVSDQSFDAVDAAGHGFMSDVLIDRIEFTSTDSGGVLVGAFVGLLAGEGSLGTVVIPGYPGPDGETVQVDFGLVFAPDCNDNGIDDAEDIAQGGSFDTNGNNLPDECEFSGSLNGAVVWGTGSTVYLTSDLAVADSLTVEHGVDIVPAAGVEIVVQAGQLTINGTGGFACGGSGGSGRIGNRGGAGADGGRGGDAIGVRLEQPDDGVVAQNVITHLVAGNGANGGNGGNGGAGGDGGDGAFNVFSGGNGGNAGNGGSGGDAGDGGRGGRAQPISVVDHANVLVLSQNTVGGNLTRGTAGVAGVAGSGGPAGSAGSGAATGGSDGASAAAGSGGAVGINGVIGNAVGINASAGPSPVITASNNIVVPGNAGYSVGMQAEGNAVIVGDFNCFFDFSVMVSGGVAPGGGSFVADSSFVDADGIDNLPGTEDDDRRLAAGSPCVNTGGNAEIPPDAADLDGDANTAEPLPFDADGNPRVFGAAVDVGAYEFGSAPVPCPWDVNGDGTVNTVDFLSLLQQWGTDPGGPPDINGDGTVDTVDFLALLQHWGPCP